MKRNLLKLMLIIFIPFLSCRDEVDVDGLLSFPPAIQESYPFDNGKVVIGGFDVRVLLADGKNSPLKNASVSIEDAAGDELYFIEENLSGTLDSVNIDGSEFDADQLGAGDYKMIVTAEDSKGQSITYEIDFEIITSLYPANNDEMYLAGAFNSWGALELELVGDYTWEVKNVDLAGGAFKFKNTPNWTGVDWGDPDCDKTMAVATGQSGMDTACGYTGLVNITFNDLTLKYTITPAVNFQSTIASLYAFGTFNNFQGPPTYPFLLKADHTWELAEVRLKPNDYFKLFEMGNMSGKNFGGSGLTGTAVLYGSNFVMPGDAADAFYKIVFNDQTLAYTISFVRNPYPEHLYMKGSALNGWVPWPGGAVEMTSVSPGVFEATTTLNNVPDNNTFRFFAQADWGPTSYNYPFFTSVDPIFENANDGDLNLRFIGTTGMYKIRVDFNSKTVTVIDPELFITGDDFGWGWNAGQYEDFTYDRPSGTFTITATLTNGKLFRFFPQTNWNPSYTFDYFTTVDSDLENQGAGTDQNFRYIGATGSRTITVNLTTKVVSLD